MRRPMPCGGTGFAGLVAACAICGMPPSAAMPSRLLRWSRLVMLVMLFPLDLVPPASFTMRGTDKWNEIRARIAYLRAAPSTLTEACCLRLARCYRRTLRQADTVIYESGRRNSMAAVALSVNGESVKVDV